MRAKVLVLFFVLLPGMASAWWNEDWSYRLPVKLDASPTGANLTTTATEVPVLIRLHSANFEDFFLLQDGLKDVRFIAQDDKTPLKFSVESFDLLNQLAFIWVKVPQVSGGLNTEKIWMYYGNEQAVSGQDAAGVFDVNHVAVLHFDPLANMPTDVTAYQNTVSKLDADISPTSLIAGGLSLSGDGGMTLQGTPSIHVQPDKGYTFSAWIKPMGVQNNSIIFKQSDGSQSLELAVDQSALYARVVTSAGEVLTPKTAPLTLDSWQHVALVLNAGQLGVYLNGIEVAAVSAPVPAIAGDVLIGAEANGERAVVGEMDEVRISSTSRTTAELQIAAKNQGVTGNMVAVGKGEQLGNAAGTSYFVTIFQNTGTEGWVVIILLAFMAVLSWMVMMFKAMFLGRVRKDNQAFMNQYQKLSNLNIAALDKDEEVDTASDSEALFGKHDHFQSSPLYHIYHRGIAELKDRIHSFDEHRSILSDSAVNAIRSGLEAYVTREIQGLNRNMVLLTIAVSGGPFLGLLGTVLGVMITFAAIAASGDVNIAAIAPGVAAALLTTVAGLVVAIPALFGYNWLATRIKAMVADMHVFTDEFVSKLAEQYGK